MNFKLLFVSVSILLSGCIANPVIFENSEENVLFSTSSNINESDASYLQIAKDLFVAGQYKQAYQISSNLAEKNNVEAQYLLGYMIYYGYGVPSDVKQGTKWISISADTGHRPAIEALVLIKHGLTPDNKCSSVNLATETKIEPMAESGPDDNKSTSKTSSVLESNQLKTGEILITPQRKTTVNKKSINYVKSEENWNRYTIQLMVADSKLSAINYKNEFINKYPDLSEYVIAYKTKEKPYSYAVGFSTFKKNSDAQIALDNIKNRINTPSLLVRRLDEFEPIVFKK